MKLLLTIAMLALPARAALIGVVESPGGRIELHDEPGACAGAARRAEFLPPAGDGRVPGCWVVGGGFVVVVFMDADIARIPVAAVRKPKVL